MRYAAPPELDVQTEVAPWVEVYANILFDGIVDLLPVVLAVTAVFTLVGLMVRMVRRWIGYHKATTVMTPWDGHTYTVQYKGRGGKHSLKYQSTFKESSSRW